MDDKQKKLLVGGGVAIGGILLYRRMHSTGASGTVTQPVTNSTASGSITPFVPQSPIVVPAGESIYDPNSQNLLNTPPAPSTAPAIPTLSVPQTSTPGGPTYNVNVRYPKQTVTRKKVVKPAKRKVSKRKVVTR